MLSQSFTLPAGSLLDHKTERASVPKLLYLITALYVLLLGITLYGTLVLIYFSSCIYTGGGPWDLVVFARVAVALHWVAVGAFFITTFVTFNPYPDHADIATWKARCECMCCCVSETEGGLIHGGGSVGRKLSTAMLEIEDAAASAYHPAPQGCSSDEDASQTVIHIAGPVNRQDHSDGSMSMTHAGAQALAGLRAVSGGALEPPLSHTSRLAAMLHGMFSHVDLTVSNWASCLLLVEILHRLRSKETCYGQPRTSEVANTDQTEQQQDLQCQRALERCCGCASADNCDGDVDPFSRSTLDGVAGASEHLLREVKGAEATADTAPGMEGVMEEARTHCDVQDDAQSPGLRLRKAHDIVSLQVLKDADHYFKHACAVYGWPMHMWMHLAKPRYAIIPVGYHNVIMALFPDFRVLI
jgi:hypothetical protein